MFNKEKSNFYEVITVLFYIFIGKLLDCKSVFFSSIQNYLNFLSRKVVMFFSVVNLANNQNFSKGDDSFMVDDVGKGKKILVVDDNKDILDAMQAVLEVNGFKFEGTTKGQSVGNMIIKYHPDLIIMDIYLSGEDGRQLCKKVKSTRNAKKIPVVLISAHPIDKKALKVFGADEFIPKPFDMYKLVDTIRSLTN